METKMRILKLSILLAALLAAALWALLCGQAGAQLAGGLIFPGPGLPVAAAITYVGPNDTISGATAFGSCARAVSASYAAGGGNLCDLVDSAAPTTVICTLKALTSGKVDLASASCTGGVTPSVKCAAATGGTCNVSKIYDQVNATNSWVQTSAATQPKLTFSALNGLPGMTGTATASTQMNSPSYTTNATSSSYIVLGKRTTPSGGGAPDVGLGSNAGGTNFNLGFDAANANKAALSGPSGGLTTATAADNSFHYLQYANGGTSALIVDNTPTPTGTGGQNMSSGTRILRSGGGQSVNGVMMEVGIWDLINFNSTQYGATDANSRSVSNGYGSF
jgi:hypothetical protein